MKFSTKEIIIVAVFATLTVIGTFLKIPVPPAPITMQFFFVALAGVLLGPRLGGMSIFVFMLLGLLGVPVFSEGGGLAYIFRPTFGYIVGFVLGAILIGYLAQKNTNNRFIYYFTACLAGLALIYAIGVPYLYYILKYVNGLPIDFNFAMTKGMMIFLPGDLIKSALTAVVAVNVIPKLKNAGVL